MSAGVIVVGAGYSGLCAAVDLKKQGVKVTVVEARVRLGGRCQTGTFEGEAFDVGGHWIGAQQPRVTELLKSRGYELKHQYDEGTHVLRMFGKQYKYSGNISSLASFGDILAESGKLIERFDADMQTIPLDDPTKCPRAAEWDAITLADWQKKNIKSPEVLALNNFLLWTIFTVKAEQVSYFWWLYYLRQGHGYQVLSDIRGGAQQDKVNGGLMQVCEQLAKEIGEENIHLRAPVKEIIQDANGVTVVTSNGKKFQGSHVIVTAPPTVCNDIKYTPALPAERKALHDKFSAGTVIKVYVLYNSWWWREQGLSGEMLSDEEPVTLYYDATTEKIPAFIGFIPAHLAIKWGSKPVAELKAAIEAQLIREFGPKAAKPKEIIVRPWLHDDVYCKGAYSGSMGINTLSRYGNILRKPVGRIHWAGTELAQDWCGYFEGAVESGQRAAKEVIDLLQKNPKAKL